MFKDINKSQLKPTIVKIASSTDYKTKLLSDKYKSIIKDLLKILEGNLNVKIANSKISDLEKTIYSFLKMIIGNLKNPIYLSQSVNDRINHIILEYPEVDLVQILSKPFIDLVTLSEDSNSKYFTQEELLKIAGRKKDVPYIGVFSGLKNFQEKIKTELDRKIKGKRTLSSRYKDLFKAKATTFIGKWNFNLDDFTALKKYFNDGNSVWSGNQWVSIAQDIYFTISSIKDNNYASIFSPQKIDDLFEIFKDKILEKIITIIKDKLASKQINSFTWDQIFDDQNILKNGIAFSDLFSNIESILSSYNLSVNDLSWDRYGLLNAEGNPTTTLDTKAFINGVISIDIDGKKKQFLSITNKEIKIVIPSLKRIYDYLNSTSKIAIKKEIRPKELMAILGIDSIGELKRIFNSSRAVKFNVDLANIKKIFGVYLISQADLDKIFPSGIIGKLNMDDLDIKSEITILKNNNLTPWENIKFKLTKFDIAKKIKGAPTSKYNEISLNPNILLRQSDVQSLSLVPSAKNLVNSLQTDKKLNQTSTNIYTKSVEGIPLNSEAPLKDWVSEKLTTWNKNGIEALIKKHIDYTNNKDRFTFKAVHSRIILNDNDFFTIKFSIYDKILDYEYIIDEFNYNIINFDKFAKSLKKDLENNYIINTDQTFRNNQSLTLNEAIPIFSRKDGSPTSRDLFEMNIGGRTIKTKKIEYIEKIVDEALQKFLKITYVYSAGDFSNDNKNSHEYLSEILVNISVTKATIQDLADANDKLAIYVDNAVKKIKKIFPYNSDINKDLYQDIIDQFNTDVKEDILNEKLSIKDLENKVEEAIDKIDIRTLEKIEKLSLTNKQKKDLMDIFGNDIPKEILEWIMNNQVKTKEMLDMGLNKNDIKKILSNKWAKDKIQETGVLNMKLVKEVLLSLNKIRNNNKYAYLGVGIALGVSGLIAGGASIATAKVAKRSKQLTNSQMKMKSSKLIIGLSTSIALLLMLASASLMIWVFITKGGI